MERQILKKFHICLLKNKFQTQPERQNDFASGTTLNICRYLLLLSRWSVKECLQYFNDCLTKKYPFLISNLISFRSLLFDYFIFYRALVDSFLMDFITFFLCVECFVKLEVFRWKIRRYYRQNIKMSFKGLMCFLLICFVTIFVCGWGHFVKIILRFV